MTIAALTLTAALRILCLLGILAGAALLIVWKAVSNTRRRRECARAVATAFGLEACAPEARDREPDSRYEGTVDGIRVRVLSGQTIAENVRVPMQYGAMHANVPVGRIEIVAEIPHGPGFEIAMREAVSILPRAFTTGDPDFDKRVMIERCSDEEKGRAWLDDRAFRRQLADFLKQGLTTHRFVSERGAVLRYFGYNKSKSLACAKAALEMARWMKGR
ncbi:MAG: hypothetical protein JXR37_33055 [Kiritimatiellae bacterium]|nr:hypothetical protein [Kiritimatiellia bacterium]